MSQKNFYKDLMVPTDFKFEKNTYSNYYGKFSIYPFEKGVGTTLANSLRRVLLSSIPGYAITTIKIEGINHEFEPIKGVKEDLIDIILQLKKINLILTDGSEKKIIRVNKKGKGELLAKDFAVDPTIEILNGDLKIATLNEDADISMEVQIEFGRGYRSAESAINSSSIISVIPIDAIFSPVIRVNYDIEDFRVGERTDCEKIVLEIWTNGTITPAEALSEASIILRKYLSIFSTLEIDEKALGITSSKELKSNNLLSKPIEELGLSARSYNCLKSANINTIGELINNDEDSLMSIKNFGKKSLTEIIEKLKSYNLSLKNNIKKDNKKDHKSESTEEGE